ncbi:MAG: NADH-quinone oxidoreductase subunit C [Burkholderiales bacterium]|jgi:NADH-quinone oxidoreductase subunit C|nr:NADH-quinone oxidoreductase subunit C [Burkholderiales bacterium]
MKISLKRLDIALRDDFARLFDIDAPQRGDLQHAFNELTLEVPANTLFATMQRLRDLPQFAFDTLVDITGVDYLDHRNKPKTAVSRFAVVYHLLSTTHNHRLRVRAFLDDDHLEAPSMVPLWQAANWMERETFDMFGFVFTDHPDLRRILTDYHFEGYPFRKDFPLSGHLEIRYDEKQQRIVYESVTIPPRDNVPNVVREPDYADNAAKKKD